MGLGKGSKTTKKRGQKWAVKMGKKIEKYIHKMVVKNNPKMAGKGRIRILAYAENAYALYELKMKKLQKAHTLHTLNIVTSENEIGRNREYIYK